MANIAGSPLEGVVLVGVNEIALRRHVRVVAEPAIQAPTLLSQVGAEEIVIFPIMTIQTHLINGSGHE
jgi:hypothetical protein